MRQARRVRAGLTLIEVLSVFVIVASLSALLTPVFRSAVFGAQTWASNHRMRQAHMALVVYAQEYGGGQPGAAAQMGFPDSYSLYFAMDPKPGGEGVWQSACPRDPHGPGKLVGESWIPFFSYYPENDKVYEDYALRVGDRAIILADEHCMWPNATGSRSLSATRIFWVSFDGALRQNHGYGSPGDLSRYGH